MKLKLVSLITLLALVLTGCSFQNKSNRANAAHKYYVEKRETPKNNLNVIPTLFFHGGLSNYHGEENMVKAAKEAETIEITFNLILKKMDVTPEM